MGRLQYELAGQSVRELVISTELCGNEHVQDARGVPPIREGQAGYCVGRTMWNWMPSWKPAN